MSVDRESSGADPSPARNMFQAGVRDIAGFGSGWHIVVRRVRASKDVWGNDAIKTTTFGGPKLPQRRQNILRIRIVAERLTHVDEEVFVSRSKHKTSPSCIGSLPSLCCLCPAA